MTRKTTFLGGIAILLGFAAVQGAARETERCNPRAERSVAVYMTDAAAMEALVAAIQTDANTRWRLWNPLAAHGNASAFTQPYIGLDYQELQDVEQIAAAIAGDSELRARGVTRAIVNSILCFPINVTGDVMREYHHPDRGHYALALTLHQAIELTSAGWRSTGESFQSQSSCPFGSEWPPLRQFVAESNGSRFVTASPGECSILKKPGSGWRYAGSAFPTALPDAAGVCPAWAPTPVYRAYNNRWMHGDSNHRLTIRPESYRSMLDQGWAGEGVTMCLSNALAP